MSLGIEATGGVFVHNPTGRVDQSEQAVEQAAALHAAGIHHAGALHPAFIQPLVSGLSPTQDEITWATKVIDEYEKLVDVGESVGMLDARVIDKYEYDMATRTLDWAAACAAKDRSKASALIRAQAEEKQQADNRPAR
jgi:citrate lyase subunit beta/citryl-CoA lyase